MDLIARIIFNLTEVHPLHAMFVHFPIALSGAATFFVLLAACRQDETLENVAFANISLASVSTDVAGLTGLMDNAEIYEGQAPNVGVKIVLANLLLIVTGLIAYFRWRDPELFNSRARGLYIAAYALSFGIALVLAFLGGVILYGFL
jgi:uncharacterized membrane protein